MMSLVRSESKRFWMRRMTWYFPAILSLVILIGAIIAYFVITNDDKITVNFVHDIAGGLHAPTVLGPTVTLIQIMAFVVGASFVGADIKTGMLEHLLTWEPRRLRLLVARIIAGAWGSAVLSLAVSVWTVASMYAMAVSAGTAGGPTGEFWVAVGASIGRTALAAGLFCTLGLSITLVLNNSIGSIVGFVIYWFVVENVVMTTFLPKVGVYLPVRNTSAFASGQPIERMDGSVFSSQPGQLEFIEVHDYRVAGLLMAGYVGLAFAGAAMVFSRRDIS